MNGGPAREAPPGMTPLLVAASQWIIGVALAVMLTLFFLAVNAMQLSSEAAGKRLLARQVAVTTEIDSILPDLQEALREAGSEAEEDPVQLPDFPITVELTREEAFSLEGQSLRQRILDEASTRLYRDGMSAWAETDPNAQQEIERISIPGAIKNGLGLVTSRNHNLVLIASIVLGVLSAMLATMLLASVRGWTRLIVVGALTVVAALPALAGAIAVRFAFRTAQDEADPFVSGLLELGVEAMWVPIRNYLALSVLGFTMLALAFIFIWASSRLRGRSMERPLA